jgi:hypothetical protein
MAVKERVLHVLRGHEAGRIRFKVSTKTGGVTTINRASFEMVASAIQAGKIKVTPRTVFRAGVGAEYHGGAIPGASSGELLVLQYLDVSKRDSWRTNAPTPFSTSPGPASGRPKKRQFATWLTRCIFG